ncbi:MAG: molecular chaperone DnaK, partial [Butyrivibrio sp.]|nr:molecular chaperone DnaK [Butyrivibrio sp.]
IDSLKSQKEKLMNDAQALFAKMYENVQGAASAGPNMGAGAGPDMGSASQSSSNNNDDVVDGDYREV